MNASDGVHKTKKKKRAYLFFEIHLRVQLLPPPPLLLILVPQVWEHDIDLEITTTTTWRKGFFKTRFRVFSFTLLYYYYHYYYYRNLFPFGRLYRSNRFFLNQPTTKKKISVVNILLLRHHRSPSSSIALRCVDKTISWNFTFEYRGVEGGAFPP